MGWQQGLSERLSSHSAKIGFGIGLAFVFGFSYFLSSSAVVKDYVKLLAGFIRDKPLEGAGIYLFLSVGITVSGIPFSFVDLAAAAVYPLATALLLSFIAKSFGALGCYLLTRYNLIPGGLRDKLLANPFISRINKRFRSRPLYYAVLMRFASVPMFVKNYGLACLDISLGHFMIACMTGSVVFVPIQVTLGKSLASQLFGFEAVEGTDGGTAQFAQTAGAVIAMVSLVKCASHFSSLLLEGDEKQEPMPTESQNITAQTTSLLTKQE